MTDGGALDATRDRVLERAAIRDGETVLDVGAGDGWLTFGALPLVGDAWVIAIDSSVSALDVLRCAAHEGGAVGIRYLLGDADVLPLPDASADVALGRSVLAGAAEPTEAARELHRVLRSAGRVSLIEPAGAGDLLPALDGAGFEDVQVVHAEELEPALVLVAARRM